MMSTLTVLVFCLPPDSGEKIALGVTVLLAFSGMPPLTLHFAAAWAVNLGPKNHLALYKIYNLNSTSLPETVFMLAIAEKMPETSESIPLIGEQIFQILPNYITLRHFLRTTGRLPSCLLNWQKKYPSNSESLIDCNTVQYLLLLREYFPRQP